ncbi:unnamed protein product [Lepeophtheirus salmonis]|uniref:(salmon louse) hypothetical protein n=1 Tax=Lepeophtheirus salmonis TaxID=72036 RepID=A0A7R8CGC1_LEPSM|nr:unnamed protein product [Lepeophtheirus salmonis]CAF2774641.1 unnamed protein product [Lepeophtheirus salmonis]
MFFAFVLNKGFDPSLQRKELNEEEMNMAMGYANEKYPALVPIIMKFQARSPPFFNHSSNILSAVYQLITAAALSSKVERVFSSFWTRVFLFGEAHPHGARPHFLPRDNTSSSSLWICFESLSMESI